jgi:hypothetical protein
MVTPNALSSLDRFATRSRIRTILVFGIGYGIWQPIVQLLLRIGGEPVPFQTMARWTAFEGIMITVGAVVGAVWFTLQKRPPSWTRDWIDNSLRMTALGCVIGARDMFAKPLFVWLTSTVIASLVLGALWTAIARAAGKDSDGGRLTRA